MYLMFLLHFLNQWFKARAMPSSMAFDQDLCGQYIEEEKQLSAIVYALCILQFEILIELYYATEKCNTDQT